jgi:hypothetical protein
MQWPTAEQLARRVPPPDGYRYAVPETADVPALVRAVDDWFPGLAVGNASCFLREQFYIDRVRLADRADGEFFVMLFKHGLEWAGVLAVEHDRDSQVLYGRVGTVGRDHRGAGLSRTFPPLMEAMGTAIGAGMVYSLATLKVPHMQRGFEQAGWQLAGVMPGFDREVVEDGAIKRVFEAIYVKVLAAQSELLHPDTRGMTPATRSLYELLYARGGLCNPSVEELLTTKQQVAAMKAGGEVASKYRVPGK